MTEALDFRIVRASSDVLLRQARALRAIAYERHVPGMGQPMLQADAYDHHPATVVLVALDKATGAAIGTMRMGTNAQVPLPIETAFPLGHELEHKHLAELTRLAVHPTLGNPLVRTALFKAFWILSIAKQVDHWVIGARSLALRRTYLAMGFRNLSPVTLPVSLGYAGNIEHHVMALDVLEAPRIWRELGHSIYKLARTHQVELQLFDDPCIDEPLRTSMTAARAQGLQTSEKV